MAKPIKAKWLVYGKSTKSPDTYSCWNMDNPFHSYTEAEAFAKKAEPWQKPFVRCYWDQPIGWFDGDE